ncbi:hypothetical protein TGRH88_036910 [Toxoplasma gondii]|uniref:Transmembrane protein n=1 Tax=Toxoplasma gondii TaxID=5811 RepID=A0A7J6K8B8_TOXGO|nr:hypothetical protein TGRH88_036910 [Toxoplasma gondii]
MAGRQAALFLVVLSVAAGPVSQLARASDDSVDSVETARQHMELAIEADEEMHEAYDPLLEFVETFREIKKAVEEDAALSTDAIDRVSQFDLVSLLDAKEVKEREKDYNYNQFIHKYEYNDHDINYHYYHYHHYDYYYNYDTNNNYNNHNNYTNNNDNNHNNYTNNNDNNHNNYTNNNDNNHNANYNDIYDNHYDYHNYYYTNYNNDNHGTNNYNNNHGTNHNYKHNDDYDNYNDYDTIYDDIHHHYPRLDQSVFAAQIVHASKNAIFLSRLRWRHLRLPFESVSAASSIGRAP